MLAFILHLYTEHAEIIVKFVYVIIHTAIIVYSTKISYLYFSEEAERSKPEADW